MPKTKFQAGDWVIYRKTKQSLHPGPRAQSVHAFEKGDGYSYVVEKFWIVAEIREDGALRLKTRRGKEHLVSPDDPQLRKANWWERWRYRSRFEAIHAQQHTGSD